MIGDQFLAFLCLIWCSRYQARRQGPGVGEFGRYIESYGNNTHIGFLPY